MSKYILKPINQTYNKVLFFQNKSCCNYNSSRFAIYLALLFFTLVMLPSQLIAQPIDLMIPRESSPDRLSHELRNLQALTRDLAIEKLVRGKSKLDAFLELGELRFSQGKLKEAQRFFEMAMKIDPKSLRANQGLTMVHYEKGEFNLARSTIEKLDKYHPISDQLEHELKSIRSEVNSEAQLGLQIQENDKGLLQVTTSAEAFIPSFTYRKIYGRFRFENRDYEDGPLSVSSRVYASTLDYKMDDKTSFSATYSPESFNGNKSVGGYSLQAISGTNNLHIAVGASKATFRDNFVTIQNQMSRKNTSLSLFGELHKRTRIVQTITISDISDGNSSQRYDSEMLYFLYRRGAPLLSLNLKLSHSGYANQIDENGNMYNYWSPSSFNGSELTASWERSIGVNWWWGIDASAISNSYKLTNSETLYEKGAGVQVHASYKFSKGRIYAAFADRINDYVHERKLELHGSIDF